MGIAARASTGNRVEARDFGMHPKLLLDVIQRQAGTLAKAILEGVMNSIDAGCTKCDIRLDHESVVIDDDGQGITDIHQIEKFFEKFGQPHDESEKKIYGTFRMGRGQMFAYGVNQWRTGPFEMRVNVKDRGTKYDLVHDLQMKKGCYIAIKLYTRLMPSDLAETERLLKEWLKYAPSKITFNGTQINKDPEQEKWTFTTDEAYIRLVTGGKSLSLYNLGVHTMDFSGHRFGTGGVIVSRKQLKVNFARNDVQSDCPVWKVVKPLIDKYSKREITRKPSLNSDERQRLCDLIAQGDIPDNAGKLKLFMASSGRYYSAADLWGSTYHYHQKITSAPAGDRIADRLLQQKMAFVMSHETLAAFDVELPALVKLIDKISGNSSCKWQMVSFKDLSKSISEKHDLLPDKDLTAMEKAWKNVAMLGSRVLSYHIGKHDRKICIGQSETADGWTDGSELIALNRDFLKKLKFNVEGAVELAMLLLHEFCHDDMDTGTHVHNQEFHEAYHDYSAKGLHICAMAMFSRTVPALQSASLSVSKTVLRDQDREASILKNLEKMVESLKKQRDEAIKVEVVEAAAPPKPAVPEPKPKKKAVKGIFD